MMSVNFDLNQAIKDYWWYFLKIKGLLFTLLITLFAAVAGCFLLGEFEFWTGKTLVYIFTCEAITAAIWLICRFESRIPRGKIGFLVAIDSETRDDKQRIRSDFISVLARYLQTGRVGQSFQLKSLPEHYGPIATREEAAKLARKFRARFVLFGSVRKRVIKDESTYVIDMRGLVTHAKIPEPLQEQFKREFSGLFPSRLMITEKDNLPQFEISAEGVEVISKYIIGISLYLSGFLAEALALYHAVRERIETKTIAGPPITAIAKRLPDRFIEYYGVLAQAEFERWLELEGDYALDKYYQLVDGMVKYCPKSIHTAQNVAIASFLRDRDCRAAFVHLEPSRNVQGGVYQCSLAFLHAYMCNLSDSQKQYDKAQDKALKPNTIKQIESFISIILTQEPDKVQLHYCLGYINWKFKGDKIAAINDFKAFLRNGSKTAFPNEYRLAQAYLSQLKKKDRDA